MCDYTEGKKSRNGLIYPKRDIFNKNEVFEFDAESGMTHRENIEKLIKKRHGYKHPYIVNIREI